MNAPNPSSRSEPRAEVTLESLLLPGHHDRLELIGDQLAIEASQGSSADLQQMWASFVREFDEHLAIEESVLLPQFTVSNPTEARALLEEHAELRRHRDLTQRELALQRPRLPELQAFLHLLRQHSHREDRVLYAWAARQLTHEQLHEVRARIKALMGIGQAPGST